MINITKLYCGLDQPADHLRYGHGHGAPKSAAERRPIVVWNISRRCNLQCVHCYSDSDAREYPGELSLDECYAVVEDLADFGVPGLLLSGGEPLMHEHLFDIAARARSRGIRVTLSTNATLIDREVAQRIKDLEFAYVGISLDGIGETHDQFRGRSGAFEKTVRAFEHCKAVGQKVGLRLTLSRNTVDDLDQILDFIKESKIDRVCFYHLVYSGRGADLQLLRPGESRDALDRIIARTAEWHREGDPREVLTVDQPADGPYLWMKMKAENHPHADKALELMQWNGGGTNGSGIGIGNIDSQGDVHADQFWQTYSFGNVRERPFSKIWSETDDPILLGLRKRKEMLKGRCAQCRFLNICGGGFRVRAFQKFGDPWQEDPGCYLSDEEISGSRL